MPKLLNPTLTQLKVMLWKVYSLCRRKKAADFDGYVRCVTCGAKIKWERAQLGHYYPRPECPLSLFFSNINTQIQCVQCNKWKHGNLTSYALYLQRTYGRDVLEILSEMKLSLKNEQWTEEDFKSKIEMYKEKFKKL